MTIVAFIPRATRIFTVSYLSRPLVVLWYRFTKVIRMIIDNWNFFTDEPFDTYQIATFAFITKCISRPTFARTCGSPNAMDITFWLIRQILIEYMRNIIIIDAPASNIRSDE